jgi:hypothetical protein
MIPTSWIYSRKEALKENTLAKPQRKALSEARGIAIRKDTGCPHCHPARIFVAVLQSDVKRRVSSIYRMIKENGI